MVTVYSVEVRLLCSLSSVVAVCSVEVRLHSIFFRHRVHTSQYIDLCIWHWVELLGNSFIDNMHLIISGTENNAIEEVLVFLRPWIANSWIDPIDESVEISTKHGLGNLYYLMIIYSQSSTNFQ